MMPDNGAPPGGMQYLTPEQIDAWAKMGSLPDRQALMGQKRADASGMMGTPTPKGQNVGNTYVAASPLEHLSAALSRVAGAYQKNAADEQMQQTFAQQDAGRQAMMQADQASTRAILEAMQRFQQQMPQQQPQAAPEYWQGGFTPGAL